MTAEGASDRSLRDRFLSIRATGLSQLRISSRILAPVPLT